MTTAVVGLVLHTLDVRPLQPEHRLHVKIFCLLGLKKIAFFEMRDARGVIKR